MASKYAAPNGNPTISTLQLKADPNGDGVSYSIKERDGSTLVATSYGPSIDDAATALRARGEPLMLPIEVFTKSNDGAYRAHASGLVAQGQMLLVGRAVA